MRIRYNETATALYKSMADDAVIIAFTLMSKSHDLVIFKRAFAEAGWRVVHAGEPECDPLLLIKGERPIHR